jgi:uncharacterized membrane protein
VLPPSTRVARAAILLGLEAISCGFAIARAVAWRPGSGFAPEPTLAIVAAAVAVAGLAVGALLFSRRREGFVLAERIARRATPLGLLGIAPVLFDRSLWNDDSLTPHLLIAAYGVATAATLRVAWRTAPAFPGLGNQVAGWPGFRRSASLLARPLVPLATVVAATVAYAAYFSYATIENHRNLHTNAFDLGLEENLVWHTLQFKQPLFQSTPFSGPTGTHFGNHATWFVYVIAPIYALVPRPETLLVVQAILMGGAAVPLFLYAKRHVTPWSAAAIAFAYLEYPPLHGANLYDFHYLPLGVPFLWLTLLAVEANRPVLAVAAAVLTVSVREDMAGCLAIVGLLLLVSGSAARAGTALLVLAGGYCMAMKFFIMPWGSGGGQSLVGLFYGGLLPKGRQGYAGVLETVIANPGFTWPVILEFDKLIYLSQLLAPLVFLPVTRPISLLLVVPGIFFTLLSTGYEPLYRISFQYTSYWTAFLFIGLVLAMEHAGRARDTADDAAPVRRYALVAALVVASLACTNLEGAFLRRYNVRTGFGRVDLTTTDDDLKNRAYLGTLLRQIPPDAKIVASERLLPHVAARSSVYRMIASAYDADWLLYEQRLLVDEIGTARSCFTGGAFGVVDEQGPFVLARRGAPTDRNEDVLRSLRQ